MSFTHSELRMHTEDESVQLWSVKGLPDFYPTKIVAEAAARAAFPNEDSYRRVFFQRFYMEDVA
jgi:hypothetical protein